MTLDELRALEGAATLCYVRGQWAYFTTQPLGEQWGDDWDDAPYEHNAGEPYTPSKLNTDVQWEIVKVPFDGNFERPCDGHLNSPFSVRSINTGAIAWLRTSSWSSAPPVAIPAGTTLADFRRLVKQAGGTVYSDLDAPALLAVAEAAETLCTMTHPRPDFNADTRLRAALAALEKEPKE